MPIINPLPYTIANGDPVDATPVTVNFNQIVADVNSGAAAVGGLASQEFFVAPTANPAGALPLLQAQQQFTAQAQLPGVLSNVPTSIITDCSATTLGYAQYIASTLNTPVAGTYGILLTVSNAGSPIPNGINWIFQFATDTNNNPTYHRQNINNGGWGTWVSIADQFAALNGSAAQVFNVATAAIGTEAVPLAQVQADFAALNGNPGQGFNVAPAANNSTNAPQIAQTLGAGALAYINQTASRAINVLYTNNTGRPLYVSIVAQVTLPPVSTPTVGEFTIYVNSTLVQHPSICSTFSTSATFTLTASCVVPPGATYSMGSGSSPTIVDWYEF